MYISPLGWQQSSFISYLHPPYSLTQGIVAPWETMRKVYSPLPLYSKPSYSNGFISKWGELCILQRKIWQKCLNRGRCRLVKPLGLKQQKFSIDQIINTCFFGIGADSATIAPTKLLSASGISRTRCTNYPGQTTIPIVLPSRYSATTSPRCRFSRYLAIRSNPWLDYSFANFSVRHQYRPSWFGLAAVRVQFGV